jgi:hypothetical protein
VATHVFFLVDYLLKVATLGIVEFGVFLWGKFGTIDKEIKKKFADVHFALFLTAIFNAFQYSLTSIVSSRLSNGSWVKTEQLELDHYVEIREEYERVQEIINLQYTGCGKWFRNCILFVFRPGLRRRHESLRVQVRFHELRLHFLESNNLSFSLKVSDYLKRSELSILIGLVHVSITTWVLLIGLLNLGYFVFGIIGYNSSNPGSIAAIMTAFFFVVVVLFIFMSLALRWKMHQIFQTVMKTKVIETSDREEGIKNQQQLFWFGSPSLVISMIQLMNFGYAISISIVIIYFEYWERAELFLVVSVGCYIVFLYNLSALLPEYTLCTSLGYLTNRKELQETVARHRLEEAERQRRKKMIENATVNDSIIFQAYPVAKSSSTNSLPNALLPVFESSIDGSLLDDKDKKAPLLVSDLVKIDTKALRKNLPEESRESLINREERMRQRRSNRRKSVSDGVATMRAWNQGNGATISKETKEITKRNPTRRTRIKKTTSQPGVIEGWRNITVSENQRNIARPFDDMDAARIGKAKYRRKSNSDPRAIKAWKEALLLEKGPNIEGIVSSEEEGPVIRIKDAEVNKDSNGDLIPKWKKDRLNRLAARNLARKKTQSASAVIQSWQDHSARESTTESSGIISDENYNSGDLRALSSDDGSDDNLISSKMKTSCFYGGKTNNHTPFVKQKFRLGTLNEIEDHSQVSPRLEDDTEATIDTKIILDLSDAVIIDDVKDCKVDDDNTINTAKSIGNLSDIDVIQTETVGILSDPNKTSRKVNTDKSWYSVITREVRLYFFGSTYRNVSHVVGTSIVFCFIGCRVEIMIMLTKAGISNDEDIPLIKTAVFWLEALFLSWFIITDFVILILFPSCKYKTENERRLVLATIIDIIIVGIVLALFFVAEAERCCTKQSEETISGRLPESYDDIGEDYIFESDCTCPRWGDRTYGGLGMIEPFTSLILLRLFRFQFAHSLMNSFNHKKALDESIDDSESNPGPHDNKNYSDYEGQIGHGRDDDHEKKSGSALELWERAIAEFPDIVEKYGQFSGELLQAMLGVEGAVESSSVSFSKELVTSETQKNTMETFGKCDNMKSHIKLAQSRYAKLPPRAQGIVIAGSLRKPVRPMHPEVWEKVGFEPSPASLSRTGLVDFEIDNEQMLIEQNTSYTFVAPFARLVRSMRRCDRRHLPLLKGWISVDVVMTQFEIVVSM